MRCGRIRAAERGRRPGGAPPAVVPGAAPPLSHSSCRRPRGQETAEGNGWRPPPPITPDASPPCWRRSARVASRHWCAYPNPIHDRQGRRSPRTRGHHAGAAPPGSPAGTGVHTLTLSMTARAACRRGCACRRAWRCHSAPLRPCSSTRATRMRASSSSARPASMPAPWPRRTRPRSRPPARPCAACARRPRCGASCWPRSPLKARPQPGLGRLDGATRCMGGGVPGHAHRPCASATPPPCPNSADAAWRAWWPWCRFACMLRGDLVHGCSLRKQPRLPGSTARQQTPKRPAGRMRRHPLGRAPVAGRLGGGDARVGEPVAAAGGRRPGGRARASPRPAHGRAGAAAGARALRVCRAHGAPDHRRAARRLQPPGPAAPPHAPHRGKRWDGARRWRASTVPGRASVRGRSQARGQARGDAPALQAPLHALTTGARGRAGGRTKGAVHPRSVQPCSPCRQLSEVLSGGTQAT